MFHICKPSNLLASVSVLTLAFYADAVTGQESGGGFSITVGNQVIAGNKAVKKEREKVAKVVKDLNLSVQLDSLGAKPRLDLLRDGPPKRAARVGETVSFVSQTNFPDWIKRSELLIVDRSAIGGPRVLQTLELAPNKSVDFTVPNARGDKSDLVAIYRVYDDKGRFNETKAISVTQPDLRFDGSGIEKGSDNTAIANIPVAGGAVTIKGDDLPASSKIEALGRVQTTNASGDFVLQRIFPVGDHTVSVSSPDGRIFSKSINIPKSEWVYFAVADLTFGRRLEGGVDAAGQPFPSSYNRGRLAGYANGRNAKGVEYTIALDTGEDELSEIFRDLDKKDPKNILRRMQAKKGFPVYGDDSTIEQDAPTDGKFYLKAEKDNNFALWGRFDGKIDNGGYLRNARSLYGLQAHYETAQTTSRGQPRFETTLFAALPEKLAKRDAFLGTGGSAYFLQNQDIGLGSEVISVEIRDQDTDRLIERKQLTYGTDYDINYTQGIVTLSGPLSGFITDGISGSSTHEIRLAVQYEYTPVLTNIDGANYGGRIAGWVSDTLRFGVTGIVENTGLANQTAIGADIRYEISERSFVDLEFAATEGPGFGFSYSDTGGYLSTTFGSTGQNRRAEAWRFNAQADIQDLGFSGEGVLGTYYETRQAGFSTLDYNVSVDEELFGFYADIKPTELVTWSITHDQMKDANGKRFNEVDIAYAVQATDQLKLEFGASYVDKNTPNDAAKTGMRTDLSARITYEASAQWSFWAFGQGSAARSNLRADNRLGVGARYRPNEFWEVSGEISGGNRGLGAQIAASYQKDAQSSAYIGYELTPAREFAGITLQGRDSGRFTIGGKRRVSDNVNLYGDNSYDLFGAHKTLTSSYGIEVKPTEFLTFTSGLEISRVEDSINGDLDRTAVSFEMRYQEDDGLSAKARLELRQDRGVVSGINRDTDGVLLSGTMRKKISESARVLASFDYISTDATSGGFGTNDFTEVTLGYGYRPIDNDRLNVLFKYTYLRDMYGQFVNGVSTPGPRQESHVFNLDASYDLNERWTLGGKIGARFSRSSPSGNVAFAQNNATLAVANIRYHFTHRWDAVVELRSLNAPSAGFRETGVLGAVYRHVNDNVKFGIGFNGGTFSDDLTDLTYDDKGVFVNIIAKF